MLRAVCGLAPAHLLSTPGGRVRLQAALEIKGEVVHLDKRPGPSDETYGVL
jgi:hypothetical protein